MLAIMVRLDVIMMYVLHIVLNISASLWMLIPAAIDPRFDCMRHGDTDGTTADS